MRTLWSLIWLIVLALGSAATTTFVVPGAASPRNIFDNYDGQVRPTTAYDAIRAADGTISREVLFHVNETNGWPQRLHRWYSGLSPKAATEADKVISTVHRVSSTNSKPRERERSRKQQRGQAR